MSGWNAWNQDWIWSLGVIAVTMAIHVTGVGFTVIALERAVTKTTRPGSAYLDNGPVSFAITLGVALLLALLHAIESMVWAFVYVRLGAITSPADAALYSVDSMTTRGASGLVLEPRWSMVRVWKRAPW